MVSNEAPGVLEPTAIERDCFRVLSYFAYFRYPLTAFEVWKWLCDPAEPWTPAQVLCALSEGTWLRQHIEEYCGVYGFRNVAAEWRDRRARYGDAARKHRVVRAVAAYVGRLPSVRAVAVCNSLAYHHTTSASDIDLFVVTEASRVWTARLFVVSMLALVRRRPGEAKRDPVCCSFFADADALDFSCYRIADEDPYLMYWSATLMPVVDHGDVFARFAAENRWAFARLPNATTVRRSRAFRSHARSRFPWHGVREAFARRVQEKRFPRVIHAMKNGDTRVVVNDHVLKLHTNDRRQDIAKALADRLS